MKYLGLISFTLILVVSFVGCESPLNDEGRTSETVQVSKISVQTLQPQAGQEYIIKDTQGINISSSESPWIRTEGNSGNPFYDYKILYSNYNQNYDLWNTFYQFDNTNHGTISNSIANPNVESNMGPSAIEITSGKFLFYKEYGSKKIYAYFHNGGYNPEILTPFESSYTPYPVFYSNKIYVFYKKVGSPKILYRYINSYTTSSISFSNEFEVPSSETSDGPSVTSFNGKLYLFYKAKGNKDVLYKTMNSSGNWGSEIKLSNSQTQTTPSVHSSAYFNKLYLVYRSNGDKLKYRIMNHLGGWSNEQNAGPGYASKTPDFFIEESQSYSNGGRLHVVYKDDNSKNLFYTLINL